MKQYFNVEGSMDAVSALEVNVDTVYIRTNIRPIERTEPIPFKGWEYDEVQYSIREYIGTLTSEEDSGMLALMVSMLMAEVDMLKAQIGGL